MADYQYIGTVAYIQPNKQNIERLSVLAHAVDRLAIHTKTVEFNEEAFQNVMGSANFQDLYEKSIMTYVDECELPRETPDQYTRPFVKEVNIKDEILTKLYIPATSKHEDCVKSMVYGALVPVLEALFEDDLVAVKTREAVEYQEFGEAKEQVVLSIDRPQRKAA